MIIFLVDKNSIKNGKHQRSRQFADGRNGALEGIAAKGKLDSQRAQRKISRIGQEPSEGRHAESKVNENRAKGYHRQNAKDCDSPADGQSQTCLA